MITCSIGIMAYNEEANIGRLLDALRRQNLSVCSIKEIWVVASGCEDGTEDIVRNQMQVDKRIKLLVQEKREGKASAINLFLSKADAEVLVLESGDTIPETDTIEKLVSPFTDPEVGMTGGHPVPVDPPDSFIGFAVSLLWKLHHRIALESPKLGELVAFRNVVKEIPKDTAVDEASIEAIVTRTGFKLKYVEDAIVYNKGPENIRDFLKQRRRIAAGHLYVRHTQGHSVSTTSSRNILGPFVKELMDGRKKLIWITGTVLLEIWGRVLGSYDFHIRKSNPFVWDIAKSTKELKGLSK
jgi:cellulose synthase/poly-beta-1,6-N-acetylglucosamine synthase-like glycosyltransferase